MISNSQKLDTVSFSCDAEWDGYNLTAVFKNGYDKAVEVMVEDEAVAIPAQVLSHSGNMIIGVYGTKDDKVMPTLWSDQIPIEVGVDTNGIHPDAETASLYEQIRDKVNGMDDSVEEAIRKAESAEASVAGLDERIHTAENTASDASDKADALSRTVETYSDAIASKANASDVSALGGRVDAVETAISTADGQIEALDGQIGNITDTVTALETAVSTKAESTAVTAAFAEVGQALNGKQDAINDLDNIRSGAAKGETALQSVPDTYRTADAQDAIDAGKQDAITDLDDIREGAEKGATALQEVPVATSTTVGGVKVDGSYGVAIDDGLIYVNPATNSQIDARTNDRRPITAKKLVYAVDSILTSTAADEQLTDAEKAAACARIGAERKLTDGWTLVATITDANKTPVDLTGKHELIITGQTVGTGDGMVSNNVHNLIGGAVINGTRTFMAYFADVLDGYICLYSRFYNGDTPLLYDTLRTYDFSDMHISRISILRIGNASVLSSCNVKIYAR